MNLDAFLADSILSWREMLCAISPDARLRLFEDTAGDIAGFIRREIGDKLEELAVQVGDGLDDIDARQRIIAAAILKAANGCDTSPEPLAHAMSAEQWLKRDLAEPDRLLGHWLTTTTRALLFAPTGLGKTMLGMGIGVACACGLDFLHRKAARPAKELLIDGEMSRRLLQQRLRDEINRAGGVVPAGLHILSHEDIEDFAPLNTLEGQAQIEREIERIGGVDLVIFDNIMSLISGDQKDEESWRDTLRWIRSLTKRKIGQLWVHHTGHDEGHSYGTKIREWQMDTVVKLERTSGAKNDVEFKLSFPKARERTPATRTDFADVNVALVDDQWTFDAATGETAKQPAKVSPLGLKFLDALHDAASTNTKRVSGCPAADVEQWKAKCIGRGLLDPPDGKKADAARSLFSKHRRELIAADYIVCDESTAWITVRGQIKASSRVKPSL